MKLFFGKRRWTDENIEDLPHGKFEEVETSEHEEGWRAGPPLDYSRSWYYRAGQQARWEEMEGDPDRPDLEA